MRRGEKDASPFSYKDHQTLKNFKGHQTLEPSIGHRDGVFFHLLHSPLF
jgi:hypothetical protein